MCACVNANANAKANVCALHTIFCVFYIFILNAGGLLFFMAFCLAVMFRNFDEIWRRKRIIRANVCVLYAVRYICCIQ